MQSLGHAPPGRTQCHQVTDILVLPGLRPLLQKVEHVHVAHTVGDQHHRAPIQLVHLLDHRLEGQEVGPVFICGPEPGGGQAGKVLGPKLLTASQARPRTKWVGRVLNPSESGLVSPQSL